MEVSDQAPFDANGNMLEYPHKTVVAMVCPETGELFHHGIDYGITLPDGSLKFYKDSDTQRRLVSANPLEVDSEMLEVKPFAAKLRLDHLSTGVTGEELMWMCDEQGRRYPLYGTYFDAACQKCADENHVLHGVWQVVRADEGPFSRYSLRAM